MDKYLALPNLARTSSVVGIRNGSEMVNEFNLRKSTTILTVPSFFRIGMGGLDHSEDEGSIIPRFKRLSNSVLKAFSRWSGIE